MAQREGNTIMHLESTSGSTIELHFNIAQVEIKRCDNLHCILQAEGMEQRGKEKGAIELPSTYRTLFLPAGTQIEIDGIANRGKVCLKIPKDKKPKCWSGPRIKSSPGEETVEDEALQTANELEHYKNTVEIEDLGEMMGQQVYRIGVHPATFADREGEYQIYTDIEATLQIKSSGQTAIGRERGGILIVGREEYRDGLRPYARWKRQEGYSVSELYVNTADCDSIKEKIRPYFSAVPPTGKIPEYILLVGDADQINPFRGINRPSGLPTHATDLYYAEYSGDYLPEAYIGRWAVNDTSELRIVVEKTLRYEQGLQIDTPSLQRMILVAGKEERSVAPTTTNGHVNYISQRLSSMHPPIDTICYRNPESGEKIEEILGEIHRGAAAISYTAHCSAAGWTNPALTASSLTGIHQPQTPIWINNCCLSNDFSDDCFGERLLRDEEGGAVAVVGATNSTLWEEDYYWAIGPQWTLTQTPSYDSTTIGAFDVLINSTEPRVGTMLRGADITMGQILAAGNMAVSSFGSTYDCFYWETYCLLGDPTLVPYLGIPQRAILNTTIIPTAGDTIIQANATPNARVTAIQNERLLASVLADSLGAATLRIETAIDASPIILTCSGRGLLPAIETLCPTPYSEALPLLRDVRADETGITCTIYNAGQTAAEDISVVIIPDITGASFHSDTLFIDTLSAEEEREIRIGIHLAVWDTYWAGNVAIRNNVQDILSSQHVSAALNGEIPQLYFNFLQPDSTFAKKIEESVQYILRTTASDADSFKVAITSLPSGEPIHSSAEWTNISIPEGCSHIRIAAEAYKGKHRKDWVYFVETGNHTDGMEDDEQCYPWRTGTFQDWIADSTVRHGGQCSMRSAPIGNRQKSDFIIEVFCPQADSVGFWGKVSSEVRYDKMTFEVDGITRVNMWGEMDWRHYSVALRAGRHTLRWHYAKDESGSAGDDCAWVDDITLPLSLWDAPYGHCHEDILSAVDIAEENTTKLYPNPTEGILTIAVDALEKGEIHIVDINGREVYKSTFYSPQSSLDLRELPQGVYLLILQNAERQERHKIIIEHQPRKTK